MPLPNIIYKLADERMWDVPQARFLTEYEATQASQAAAQNKLDADLGLLISAEGQSDEAYLLQTLQFYHFPTGDLTLTTAPALRYALEQLDAEYLTPRTLAGIGENDPEAMERWQEHERLAEPLRVKLRALEGEAEA